MYLSDRNIKSEIEANRITISDFDQERLQQVSYDILLGNKFQTMKSYKLAAVDPSKGILPETHEIEVPDGEAFVLHPGKTVLGTSKDYFGSDHYLIQLSGKSSLARIGLVVHNTAGIVNPGHFLNITFELYNAGKIPIILRPGMQIAQILFAQISSDLESNYKDTGRFNGDNWGKNLNH
ncbi:dCTP deaminase [Patescibacteria group bacterium]|nr:dCTP deaminase [Patescibacteria group bacterium]